MLLDRIMSYINNLHSERHKDLYSVIEQVVSAAVPLWNSTLSALAHEMPARLQVTGDCFDYSGLTDQQQNACMLGFNDPADDPRSILQPEPDDFEGSEFLRLKQDYQKMGPEVDLQLEHGKLQIIVKLANIHLTPEKPEYKGGSWHLEGQLNENMFV